MAKQITISEHDLYRLTELVEEGCLEPVTITEQDNGNVSIHVERTGETRTILHGERR